jgi:hypothetical protein
MADGFNCFHFLLFKNVSHVSFSPPCTRPVRCGVSKGVEDSRRMPSLRAGHAQNSCKAVLGVAHPQGLEESGMADMPGLVEISGKSIDTHCHTGLFCTIF